MGKHKKFICQVVLCLLLSTLASFLSTSSFGASLNLTASWALNSELDIKEYRLYRIDGYRRLISTVQHPVNYCNISVTFENTYAGPLTFVITSVNTNNYESKDSNPVRYYGPTVTIAATVNTATEFPLTTGYFTVTRTGSTGSALTVYYTVSGTATPNNDYNTLPKSITIPAGSSSVSIPVTPVNDMVSEKDETVIVTLIPNATYTIGSSIRSNHSATITIIDGEEIVTPPTTPSHIKSGFSLQSSPSVLYMGASYIFSASGSSSNIGSPLEYQFSWGDGTYSSWISSSRNLSSKSKIWMNAGIYQVMARARSKTNTNVVSDWSNILILTIQGKPFIQVTSPNGGENLVVGSQYHITWNSAYLNPSGTVYLFYWFDGAWRPIAMLPPGTTSYLWTVPRLPNPSTSPKPTSENKGTSIWIGHWVNEGWECFDSSDQSFRILYDGWICKLSGADQGGATVLFDEHRFEGYGISLNWGMFEIDGNYSVDTKGTLNGNFTVRDFNTRVSIGSDSITGSVDPSSKKVTLHLPTSNGTLSLSGVRFVNEPSIPENWTGILSGSAGGNLTLLEILPYELQDEIYSHVFQFSGSGTLAGGGGIGIEGHFYYTSTANSIGNQTNVYGLYQMTGAVSEYGVLTGALKPPNGKQQGTYSFNMVGESGNIYTLKGNVITP